ncbi:hypothetical protein PVAP13_4NG067496 [Panicum virgatum]|uniref:Uncharacterized protein n=1 Tax=Panicum virgatum TaxID=38727 RepID=A0A8T0T7X5_PANVG|nr:hypothetical protein PVAP13_4NG067496 [Panicum virgatum]
MTTTALVLGSMAGTRQRRTWRFRPLHTRRLRTGRT